jgi:hypothetical protein
MRIIDLNISFYQHLNTERMTPSIQTLHVSVTRSGQQLEIQDKESVHTILPYVHMLIWNWFYQTKFV